MSAGVAPRRDLSVYVIIDLDRAGPRPEAMVGAALRGGATVIQLRYKHENGARLLALVGTIRAWLDEAGVPLVINDRLDWTLSCNADGLHLGQRDLAPRDARAIAEARGSPGLWLGVSVTTVEEARSALAAGASYLSVSPVFGTPTKDDTDRAAGLEGLARIRRACPRASIVAIGNLGAARAAEVIRAGADGVAVISAVSGARHPEAATRELAARVREAKGDRRSRREEQGAVKC